MLDTRNKKKKSEASIKQCLNCLVGIPIQNFK